MARPKKRPGWQEELAEQPSSPKKRRIADSAETSPSSPQTGPWTDERSIADTSMTATSSKRPKKYLCEYEGCGKAFDRPVRLQAHINTHTNERPFICEADSCDKAFFKSEHLKAHVQNKHGDDASHICIYIITSNGGSGEVECGRAFTTASRLRRHVAAHEEKEPLKCQEHGCGMVFRKMETLQRHIRKDHLQEAAFRCSQVVQCGDTEEDCGEMFETASKLKAHERREHAGIRFFCEICPASEDTETDDLSEPRKPGFQTYAELQAHNKFAHPPQCEICGKTCESSRALKAHLEIEHSALSDRQKFMCSFPGCGRGFTKQGNLTVHFQNVHAKDRKFVCGQFDLGGSIKCPGWDGHGCGIGFGTKASLENHTRTQHLGLPSLLKKRRSKVSSELTSATQSPMSFDEPSELQDSFEDARTLSMLTGHGYEHQRPIPCWMAHCDVRFVREYDLAQHMELAHRWNVDDINERFAEKEALEGGKFWIGGDEEGAEEAAGQDEDLRARLTEALNLHPASATKEVVVPSNGLAEVLTGMEPTKMLQAPQALMCGEDDGQHDEATMLVDPVLTAHQGRTETIAAWHTL